MAWERGKPQKCFIRLSEIHESYQLRNPVVNAFEPIAK